MDNRDFTLSEVELNQCA